MSRTWTECCGQRPCVKSSMFSKRYVHMKDEINICVSSIHSSSSYFSLICVKDPEVHHLIHLGYTLLMSHCFMSEKKGLISFWRLSSPVSLTTHHEWVPLTSTSLIRQSTNRTTFSLVRVNPSHQFGYLSVREVEDPPYSDILICHNV